VGIKTGIIFSNSYTSWFRI